MAKKDVIYIALSVLLTVVVLVLTATAADQHYYVDATNGHNSNDGRSSGFGNAWKTIFHALTETTGTETDPVIIHVAAGTYDIYMGGGDHEEFPLNPEDYDTIEGTGPADTIVDAIDAAEGVFALSYTEAPIKIEGLTMTNGLAVTGGGILCYSSSPEIVNCHIEKNWAWNGGGISCFWYSEPVVSDCIIARNEADVHVGGDGGGVYCGRYCTLTLDNCTIIGNYGNDGGGLYATTYAALILRECRVGEEGGENSANTDGGGILCEEYSFLDIEDSYIEYNSSGGNGGGGLECRYNSRCASLILHLQQ